MNDQMYKMFLLSTVMTNVVVTCSIAMMFVMFEPYRVMDITKK